MLKFLHLSAIVLNLFGLWYDLNYVEFPFLKPAAKALPLRGRVLYLTIWNLTLQTLYFTVALFNDFVGTNAHCPSRSAGKRRVRKLKDAIFCSLAFPVAMFVGISFWGLYAVDRELIYPRALEATMPVWLNHFQHTNIVVFILIELLVTFRSYPTRKFGVSILSVFTLAYMVWVHVVYYKTGQWVYGIFEVLAWPLRIIFFMSSMTLVLGLYVLGEKLNAVMWPKQVAIDEARKMY